MQCLQCMISNFFLRLCRSLDEAQFEATLNEDISVSLRFLVPIFFKNRPKTAAFFQHEKVLTKQLKFLFYSIFQTKNVLWIIEVAFVVTETLAISALYSMIFGRITKCAMEYTIHSHDAIEYFKIKSAFLPTTTRQSGTVNRKICLLVPLSISSASFQTAIEE